MCFLHQPDSPAVRSKLLYSAFGVVVSWGSTRNVELA